jgi:hypothetical protein
MISKTFLNYCKYSGIWITFGLNPAHWRINFETTKPDDMDPGRYSCHIALGPLAIRLVLDDGSW